MRQPEAVCLPIEVTFFLKGNWEQVPDWTSHKEFIRILHLDDTVDEQKSQATTGWMYKTLQIMG